MPISLIGGDVEVSIGLAGVSAPISKRGVSSGGEGPPLDPGLLGNCWYCLCTPRYRHSGWVGFGGRRKAVKLTEAAVPRVLVQAP